MNHQIIRSICYKCLVLLRNISRSNRHHITIITNLVPRIRQTTNQAIRIPLIKEMVPPGIIGKMTRVRRIIIEGGDSND